MSFGSVLSWIVCGLVIGLCARFLVPGQQHMNLPTTIALGIGGALLGGFVYSLIQGPSPHPFSLASHNWYGWIVSILGAMFLVWVYPYVYPRRWYQ